MKGRLSLPSLALAASLPLIALSALAARRSVERFHTAYLISHGRLFSDDLSAGRIKLAVEIQTWCVVLGVAAVSFVLLRFWHRPNRGR